MIDAAPTSVHTRPHEVALSRIGMSSGVRNPVANTVVFSSPRGGARSRKRRPSPRSPVYATPCQALAHRPPSASALATSHVG